MMPYYFWKYADLLMIWLISVIWYGDDLNIFFLSFDWRYVSSSGETLTIKQLKVWIFVFKLYMG